MSTCFSTQQDYQGHVSSDSTSNSELTSLEYVDPSAPVPDPRIAQIDSLEAIINRLINDSETNNPEVCEEPSTPNAFNSRVRDSFTQTLSTGDIVITKVFDD